MVRLNHLRPGIVIHSVIQHYAQPRSEDYILVDGGGGCPGPVVL
jgi:hypothetical protein